MMRKIIIVCVLVAAIYIAYSTYVIPSQKSPITGFGDGDMFETVGKRSDEIESLIRNSTISIPNSTQTVTLTEGQAELSDTSGKIEITIEKNSYPVHEFICGGCEFITKTISVNRDHGLNKNYIYLFQFQENFIAKKLIPLAFLEVDDIKNVSHIQARKNQYGTLMAIDYHTKPLGEIAQTKTERFTQVYKLDNGKFVLDNSLYDVRNNK